MNWILAFLLVLLEIGKIYGFIEANFDSNFQNKEFHPKRNYHGNAINDASYTGKSSRSNLDGNENNIGFEASIKNFLYGHQPNNKEYEFGFKQGDHLFTIEKYEKLDKNHNFKAKARWKDDQGNHGEHYWDYNHARKDLTPAGSKLAVYAYSKNQPTGKKPIPKARIEIESRKRNPLRILRGASNMPPEFLINANKNEVTVGNKTSNILEYDTKTIRNKLTSRPIPRRIHFSPLKLNDSVVKINEDSNSPEANLHKEHDSGKWLQWDTLSKTPPELIKREKNQSNQLVSSRINRFHYGYPKKTRIKISKRTYMHDLNDSSHLPQNKPELNEHCVCKSDNNILRNKLSRRQRNSHFDAKKLSFNGKSNSKIAFPYRKLAYDLGTGRIYDKTSKKWYRLVPI